MHPDEREVKLYAGDEHEVQQTELAERRDGVVFPAPIRFSPNGPIP